MTDFFGSLLTQMSSAFNQPRQTTEDIELKLNDDKTLKWRGLHNNQFASAKKRGKLFKSENGSDEDGQEEQEENIEGKIEEENNQQQEEKTRQNIDLIEQNGNSVEINTNSEKSNIDKIIAEDNNDNNLKLNGLIKINNQNIEKKEKTPKTKPKKQEKFERVLRRKTIVDGSPIPKPTIIVPIPSSNSDVEIKEISNSNNSIVEIPAPIKKTSPRRKLKSNTILENKPGKEIEEKLKIDTDPELIKPNEIKDESKSDNIVEQKYVKEAIENVETNKVEEEIKPNVEVVENVEDDKIPDKILKIKTAKVLQQKLPISKGKKGKQVQRDPAIEQLQIQEKKKVIKIMAKAFENKTAVIENNTVTDSTVEDNVKTTEIIKNIKKVIELKQTRRGGGRKKKIVDDESNEDFNKNPNIEKDAKIKKKNMPRRVKEVIEKKAEIEILEDITISPTLTPTKSEAEELKISPSSSPPQISASVVKMPKKRGRKPKSAKFTNDDENYETKTKIEINKSPTKKSQRISKDNNVLASAIARKEKIYEQVAPQTQQRLSRRIKPTAKILANEELRLGFEYQNSSRLSLSSENQEHETEINEEDTKKVKEESILLPPPTPTTPPQPQQPLPISPLLLPVLQEIKPQYTPECEVTPIKSPLRRPCPDPETFLNEIKLQKIGLNRSPEDNKKLNKKQQRRLFKLKEKHLAKLGLKKTTKNENLFSDSDEVSDDNEEFVPKRKIEVGKPGVTLRMRSQHKDEKFYSAPSSSLENKIKSVKSQKSSSSSSSSSQQQISSTYRKRKLNPINNTSSSSPPSKITNLSSPSGKKQETQKLDITKKSNEISSINNNNHRNHHHQQHHTHKGETSSSHKYICLCDKKSQYYVRKTQELMQCVAIDQIENHHIGCSNEITGELINLMRPSSRVSYMILCESHRNRLIAHNCCAGCGIFCSQGMFTMCPSNHLFHRDCATKFILNTPFDPNYPENFTGPSLALKCPHCGLDATKEDFKVTLKCRESSVFLPHQLKRAKMVFASDNGKTTIIERSQNSHIDIEKIIPQKVFDIIYNAERSLSNPNLNFTTTDLFYAIHNDNIPRVAEIIASGFDITTSFREFYNGTCLHLVAGLGSVTMAYLILCKTATKYFLDLMDNELRTAIMCSVAAEKHEILKILIRCGADVSIKGSDGRTALHLAAKRGDLISTKIILDSYRVSSSVTKFKSLIDSVDDGNWTALVWAAEYGHSDIVSYLINLGADANICDNENNTALHWAALSDRIDTVLPLLQSNCDFNIQNIKGDTPLHISCRQSNTQISLVFLARGANLNIKNILDETPYDSIPDENSQCARALRFNIHLRQLINFPKRKVISNDITNGREKYPIQIVINVKDDPRNNCEDEIDLPDFKYITKTILLQNSLQIDQRISQMRICTCSDDCSTEDCQCSLISLQNWYNSEGRLKEDFNFEDPAMIFECNDVCGCNKLLCKNRVVQSGIKCRLQIFENMDQVKGWGVQTLTKILRGSFIAEYTGEILTDAEADRRTDDSYFFDLGSVDHCIDANFYGNVSRFFNHSCSPNVVPVRVYYEHQDLRFPKIAFFASRDIEAGEEITFDYGEKFWIVKFKNFTCHCNSVECKYSKTTISKTLEEYNQRNSSCVN